MLPNKLHYQKSAAIVKAIKNGCFTVILRLLLVDSLSLAHSIFCLFNVFVKLTCRFL